MAERANDLQQSIEVARQDMEETRASMTEKLELLEERVRETLEESKSAVEDIVENVKETVDETVSVVKETVDEAKSTVEDIVENVKETMGDTVTTVKRAFDLSYQMDQHPWLLFSGSVLAGGFLGSFVHDQRQANGYEEDTDEDEAYRVGLTGIAGTSSQESAENFAHATESPSATYTSQERGQLSSIGQFHEEFDIVKGAVLGVVVGILREMIRQSMPSVAPTLEKVIQSAARKLGVEPVAQSVDQQPSKRGEQGEYFSSAAMGSRSPSASWRH